MPCTGLLVRPGDAVDRLVPVGVAAQALDLALEREVLERALHGDGERVHLDRLGDEVIGAGADRADRGLETALAGKDDRQEVRIPLPELHAEVDAGHAGHLDVRHDDVDRVGPEVLEALLCRVHGIDVKAALAQTVA
jgi:hypothetical protein